MFGIEVFIRPAVPKDEILKLRESELRESGLLLGKVARQTGTSLAVVRRIVTSGN
jgi:hypothetical protein